MFRDDPEIMAVYVDTGAAFPHVRDFVARTVVKLRVPLHIERPDRSVIQWQDANGLPADIVPWDATPMMRTMAKEPFEATLVPYSTCCAANLWKPMARALDDLGAKTVIRGSKACDAKVGVPDGFQDEAGITYLSPLWNWSDADVIEYLASVGAELLPQYATGGDSFDCWCCTAFMNHHGKARFAYLKAHYPDLYPEAKRRLDSVRDTVAQANDIYPLEI